MALVEPSTIINLCQVIARMSEQPGCTTRTFLSPPMREVHGILTAWMEQLGMGVSVDPAGNLRGFYPGLTPDGPRLLIGSHLDSVPCAGAFDGILGVVMGVALIESLNRRRFSFSIEVAAFSEEEGVRFGVPFIGSRALVGTVDAGLLEKRRARNHGRPSHPGLWLGPIQHGGSDVEGYCPRVRGVSHRTGPCA